MVDAYSRNVTPSAVLPTDRLPLIAKFNYVIKAALVVSFTIAIFFPPDVLDGKAIAANNRSDADEVRLRHSIYPAIYETMTRYLSPQLLLRHSLYLL